MKEAKLGKDQELYLLDPLDLWLPIVIGGSARVFRGSILNSNGLRKMKAIKIMRPDERNLDEPDGFLSRFIKEIKILQILKGLPGIVNMQEYGLVLLDKDQKLPDENPKENAKALTGICIRFHTEELLDVSLFQQKTKDGWLPYISLDIIDDIHSLLRKSDTNLTMGHHFNLMAGLQVGYQIYEIIATAHTNNILYLDHKVWHYYWNSERVSIIDWNAGEICSNLPSDEEKCFDITLVGARVLHFIFTGNYPDHVSSLGKTQPEELRTEPHYYEVKDELLPKLLKQLLQSILAGEYFDASKLSGKFLAMSKDLHGLE